ncbi:MAG: UvrD-helicase domain-containing protein [Hyphomicrobiaceae bacterium]|nr:UvrD-helicase domain-containing protein [Hyphomicrobiaceae bacterium]
MAAARPAAGGGDPGYLAGLNPEQRLAVEALDGPVLVLAGAGTGKTRVLTTRIAHILATRRAYPSQILAVTFTNKAAREMRERIGRYVGGEVEGMPWLGTFHSIGVKILRRHAELVGLKSGFTILDPDDQLRLMKQVIEAAGIDKDRWPARQLAALIDGWKNKGLTPDKVPAGDAFVFAGGKGRDLYAAYQQRLKDLNAVDFGDLLLEGLRLFLENPDVLADYQRRFRFILVDEYQDTNVVQYLWLRLLAQGAANICCVGDDDQSIYGWRGAEVDNILRFDTDFPGARIIRLERNYRSTSNILAAASHLIAANKGRLGKTLFTDTGAAGDKVTVTGVWDDEEEARGIVADIEEARKTGHKLDEIAILVRASYQMRALEDRCIATGLPYRVIGGPRFYERAEIKDAIAYLEVTVNPANDLKFERIINVPKRGIGETTVKRIRELGRAREVPMFIAAREMVETEEVSGKTRRALADLIASFGAWRGKLEGMRHTELAELILDDSGYTAMWQADKSPQAAARLDNLKELVRFMHEFDTLAGFLEHVSLVMDTETGSDGDRVSLMTLHAAKGLEFDTVYLTGWEEGVFPSQRTLDESGLAGLEEERRLAYVGLTRAKKRAHVSFAQNRRMRGLYQSSLPSRFVDELPEAHVEVIEAKGPFGGAYQNFNALGPFGRANPFGASRFDTAAPEPRSTYDTPGWQRAERQRAATGEAFDARPGKQVYGDARSGGARPRPPKTIEGEIIASSTGTSAYAVGARVFHQKFGYGRVAEVEGNKLTVDFEKAGRKKVVDSFLQNP